MSTATAKRAPNWVLKTAMASTGALLAAMLTVRLVFNLWFFTGQQHFDAVATRGAYLFAPYLPAGAWLWIVLAVALVLIAAHVAIGVVLLLRAKAGRGPILATLHGGWQAWLSRLMPATGLVAGLFGVVYLIDQVLGRLAPASRGAYYLLTHSLSHPLMAAVYMIGLLAIAGHVLPGLGAVITIAAGGSELGASANRWLKIVGGAALGALLLASLLIPVGVIAGWFR